MRHPPCGAPWASGVFLGVRQGSFVLASFPKSSSFVYVPSAPYGAGGTRRGPVRLATFSFWGMRHVYPARVMGTWPGKDVACPDSFVPPRFLVGEPLGRT